ncbi:hypothetical protein PENSUB_3785 [Penicillium subrubescens]|uniref:Uncharacterized protein n=2 Tax=Penicillium subrubescens TaxID=1316194 RepID=A0A1Q5UEQ8_9EURO|nr:hypothetical protein PENSUB_3785 [Penicillium subrubescens]
MKLYGFVTELYSYIVLCNTITPFGMNSNRTLTHDSFLQSLDDLQDFGAFGVMFSGGHGLFELISLISLFAASQESLPSINGAADPERYEIYEQLKSRIINWNPQPTEYNEYELLPGCRATLEFCRQASLLFLETAMSPFSKYDTARICHLQPLLDVAISYMPQILPSKFSCIVMWPLMIIGSCLVEEDQRMAMKDALLHNQYMMRNTAQASNLLELLWRDPDEYAIGPYGLGLLMENYKLDYGVI